MTRKPYICQINLKKELLYKVWPTQKPRGKSSSPELNTQEFDADHKLFLSSTIIIIWFKWMYNDFLLQYLWHNVHASEVSGCILKDIINHIKLLNFGLSSLITAKTAKALKLPYCKIRNSIYWSTCISLYCEICNTTSQQAINDAPYIWSVFSIFGLLSECM